MTTPDPGGTGGLDPGGTPTPEGVFDEQLVIQIANEFYADTPPHQPESAVPKSDPVRGRDVGEEASSLTDVGNVPENALGAQATASPHGVADPAYYFLEHPEAPESPQGAPARPGPPAAGDAFQTASAGGPEAAETTATQSGFPPGGPAQGSAVQAATAAGPMATGSQEQAASPLGQETPVPGATGQPAPDEPRTDLPRSTPSEAPTPASPDAARPESGFDPARLQALAASMFAGVPSLYGVPEAGTPATPDPDAPGLGAPSLGAPVPGAAGTDEAAGASTQPGGMPSAPDWSAFAPELLGGVPALFDTPDGGTAAGAQPGAPAGSAVPHLDLAPAPGAPSAVEHAESDPSAGTVDAQGAPGAPSYYFLQDEPAVPEVGAEPEGGLDPHTIRKDFPLLQQKVHGKPLVWLDNAATTQKPQSVIDRISHFYEHDYSNIHRGAHTLAARATDAYEDAREKARRFIGAGSADELVWVRGTTEGINLIAQTWGRKYVRGGDEILLTTLEHHANIVPWQMLAQEQGAHLRVVPVNDRGEIMLEEFGRMLGPRTRIVGITQVSNALGTVVPVHEMIAAAHRHGIPVVIDGAQSIPHMRVDVQDMDADFFVFSGHKMYGPSGVGMVYAKQEHLEDMPPWQGGGNMIQSVTFEHTTYSAPPAKFEAGTPTITDAVGLGAAIDYLERIGIDNINRYEHTLTEYAMERLAEVPGIRMIGTSPSKVSVLSFILEGTRVEDVGRYLDGEGIAVRAGHHCAMPTMQRFGVSGTVRPSIAMYNTHAEVDFLVDVLKRYRSR